MLRHVIAPSVRYTKASNDVVRHKRLNSDAKILVLYVQGLPGECTCQPLGELAEKLDIKGRAYQKAKQQLIANGYVQGGFRSGTVPIPAPSEPPPPYVPWRERFAAVAPA